MPVLGLIFLLFADQKFAQVDKELKATFTPGNRLTLGPVQDKARGAIYLRPEARFSYLLDLPEGENIGEAINNAMRAIEQDNDDLSGVLPTNSYTNLDNRTLQALLCIIKRPFRV